MKIRSLLVTVSLAGFASAAVAATDVISAEDQKVANRSVIAASVSASRRVDPHQGGVFFTIRTS
jgi:hypothetical protein